MENALQGFAPEGPTKDNRLVVPHPEGPASRLAQQKESPYEGYAKTSQLRQSTILSLQVCALQAVLLRQNKSKNTRVQKRPLEWLKLVLLSHTKVIATGSLKAGLCTIQKPSWSHLGVSKLLSQPASCWMVSCCSEVLSARSQTSVPWWDCLLLTRPAFRKGRATVNAILFFYCR